MTRRSENNNILVFIGVVLAAIWWFVYKAYKAGRLAELLFSSLFLFEAYYLLNKVGVDILWIYLIPAGMYALYWFYLFSHPRILLVKGNANWANKDWWWNLDGWEFEEEVAQIFRQNGYNAKVTKKTGDDGADIIMYKNGEKVLVQCKHYASPVEPAVARELNGIREDFGASKLLLVASSGVSKSCREFIQNKPYFKVLDLEDIIRIASKDNYSV